MPIVLAPPVDQAVVKQEKGGVGGGGGWLTLMTPESLEEGWLRILWLVYLLLAPTHGNAGKKIK